MRPFVFLAAALLTVTITAQAQEQEKPFTQDYVRHGAGRSSRQD